MIDFADDDNYIEEDDFLCACEKCRCEEVVDRDGEVCSPCFFGSHSELEDEAGV